MMVSRVSLLLSLTTLPAFALACAADAEPEEVFPPIGVDTTPPPDTSPPERDDPPLTADPRDDEDDNEDDEEPDPEEEPCDFDAERTCSSAFGLSAIAGDDGSMFRTHFGDREDFVHLLVEETRSRIRDDDLSLRIQLTNPEETEYTFEVFADDERPQTCPNGGGSSADADGFWQDEWDDRLGSQDRHFVVAVKHVEGGACGPEHRWELRFDGNVIDD
ncbi:MAG: hypothetical protein AAGA56_02845 [Myxococcota bacterium]